MANRLKMASRESIQSMYQLGWSQRQIARQLGVDRETVARYIKAFGKALNQPQSHHAIDPTPRAVGQFEPLQDSITAPLSSNPDPLNHDVFLDPIRHKEPAESIPTNLEPNPANAPSGSDDRLPPHPKAEPVVLDPNPANAPFGTIEADSRPVPVDPIDIPVVTSIDPIVGTPPSSDRNFIHDSSVGYPTDDDIDDPAYAVPKRTSDCALWRDVVVAKVELGLSAKRIHQDLVADHGFQGSYYSVRRYVHRLCRRLDLPKRRFETEPGYEAQVDFGTGAPIVDSQGKRRRTYVFRIVLGFSRKAYSEVVYRQTTDNFILCLENAFRAFGGAPRIIVLDNLRAAVKKADWFDPELNPKVKSFGDHYGVTFIPARPYRPQDKGKIERGIGYVKDNALKGRSFPSLQDENVFLKEWEGSVADTRIHGTTRLQVGKLFIEVERPALLRLPLEYFASFHEGRRVVHLDGHVEIDRSYYTAPPEYLGREVWVRWDSRVVRIYDLRMRQIAIHAKVDPGRFGTDFRHIASETISGVERGAAWLLKRVRSIGPHSEAWAQAMIAERGVEGTRVLMGLLNLVGRFPADHVERACETAHRSREYRLKTIRILAERDSDKQELFEFKDKDPLIRDLGEYEQFVHSRFQKES